MLPRLGIGVPRDINKSLELCRNAAEHPHSYPVAQRTLGIAYFDGVGVQQDFREATRWFQQATQQNDVEVGDHVAIVTYANLTWLQIYSFESPSPALVPPAESLQLLRPPIHECVDNS